jgi:hypothetical protein
MIQNVFRLYLKVLTPSVLPQHFTATSTRLLVSVMSPEVIVGIVAATLGVPSAVAVIWGCIRFNRKGTWQLPLALPTMKLTDSACTARSRPTMRRHCTRRTSRHSAHHHAQEMYCLYHISSQPIPVESLPNPMFGYLGGPLYRAAGNENCHCFSEEEETF